MGRPCQGWGVVGRALGAPPEVLLQEDQQVSCHHKWACTSVVAVACSAWELHEKVCTF